MSAAVRVRRSLPSSASRVATVCPGCNIPLELRLIADAKTAPRVLLDPRKGPTAVYAQAFPLGMSGPPSIGGTCPGFTSGLEHDGKLGGCDGCYWQDIERRYSPVEALGAANSRAIDHVDSCAGARGLGVVFGVVLEHVEAHQLRDGFERATLRWNPGGDIARESIARGIARAHRARPSVDGWVYTRSLFAVRHLVGLEGLRVYVSADRVNLRRAATIAARHAVPLAVLAKDRGEAAALWARVDSIDLEGRIPRPILCPASGKYSSDGRGSGHVVAVDGSRRGLEVGSIARGACDACRVCLPGGLDRSVTFLQHGGARDVWGSVRVSISSGARS